MDSPYSCPLFKRRDRIVTVGIYIRVSTEEQVRDGFSISAQREKLKAYCVAQDWDNFKFYVDLIKCMGFNHINYFVDGVPYFVNI